jgi:putative phosphoribosyl transferase
MQFYNRAEAGRYLAQKLSHYVGQPHVVVLGLQGGGVPVANEISRSLKVPADIIVVRKLRLPEEHEVIFGAITSGGIPVLNELVVKDLELTPSRIEDIVGHERIELERKEQKFRGDRLFPKLEGQTVIVVDDGLGTGSSMRAALEAIRQQKPGRVVIGLPVAPASVYYDFKKLADEIVCLLTPPDFGAVRDYYLEFLPVTDEEIHKLLERTSGGVVPV